MKYLSFGDLRIGDCFIELPRDSFLDTRYILMKSELSADGDSNAVQMSDRTRRSLMPHSTLVIKVE